MRILSILLLIIGFALLSGFVLIKGLPYKFYSQWMGGKDWNRYYRIENYRPGLLAPFSLEAIEKYQEDYTQLWKPFPVRNSLIPLPTRHPLFLTFPLIELDSKHAIPRVGVILSSSNGRELSRIYTLPTTFMKDHTNAQDLFKLPYVKNRILQFDSQKIWDGVFSHKIKIESKSLNDMIYDLFILHLRSKLLPSQTIRYGSLGNGKALIELKSADKDYMVELVMHQQKGNIYSYILRTEKRSPDSMKLRNKFLESISFTPVDESMGRILYTEFKQLNYNRQVDQEGMLYLFAAWSQDIENVNMLKEMIFYMERGRNNQSQLKTLYQFALKKYGKTYTTRNIFGPLEDPELALQRQIEIESMAKKEEAEKTKVSVPLDDDLTADEKMNLYLKKAKEDGPQDTSEMTIH